MTLDVTPLQMAFIGTDADEVLFGGAAGGGKSYGQLIDALSCAAAYPGCRQLILRRTYPELERTLIRTALELYPRDSCTYNVQRRTMTLANGSLIEFGSCDSERDVIRYQSAEYDLLRFDELTHFTEYQYRYLCSRNRGANDFPKQVKSTANPGGVGHSWVKARFVSPAPAGTVFEERGERRLFIPAKLGDNPFLTRRDPGYRRRLMRLPDRERRALLDGDWDLFEGQFFDEFRRRRHVVRPFPIPADWRRYRTLDYGLDMLCCLWVAIAPEGRAYVYRELMEPNLIISEAARRIARCTPDGETIHRSLAPPDLYSRQRETGVTAVGLFGREGIHLSRASSNRAAGWLALKEWLADGPDGIPRLLIFEGCTGLIEALPAIARDPVNPCDCATHPHHLTHAPDALRYFAVSHTAPAPPAPPASLLPPPLRTAEPHEPELW